jgi:homoserine kinase
LASNTSAEAFAPASMGNVGVGFDIMGMAFREPGDIVRVERRESRGVVICAIEGDGGALPLEASRNTAGVAVQALLDMIGADCGISMIIKKGLPLASGLGSSAASAVAAVVATNALLGEPLSREALLPACLEGEAIVSGYHADNVGPSLLGGITLITRNSPSEIRRLPIPANMRLALVTPAVAVPTADARAVLPSTVPLRTLVSQTGAVARLVDALHRGDVREMAAAMECDSVIEPARTHLIPLLSEARRQAKHVGALGLVISGAGPTLCAVCDSVQIAQKTALVLQELYDAAGIGAESRYTYVDEVGARVTQLDEINAGVDVV